MTTSLLKKIIKAFLILLVSKGEEGMKIISGMRKSIKVTYTKCKVCKTSFLVECHQVTHSYSPTRLVCVMDMCMRGDRNWPNGYLPFLIDAENDRYMSMICHQVYTRRINSKVLSVTLYHLTNPDID